MFMLVNTIVLYIKKFLIYTLRSMLFFLQKLRALMIIQFLFEVVYIKYSAIFDISGKAITYWKSTYCCKNMIHRLI